MAEYIVGIADDSVQDVDRLHREYAVNGTIVRCRDCKHYPKVEREWCKKGHFHGNAETWFCADGERKEQK